MLKAKLLKCPNKPMAGAELKRLRKEAGFSSRGKLAAKMKEKGWGWYKSRVKRLEDSEFFCLHPLEMQDLLDVLNATSL